MTTTGRYILTPDERLKRLATQWMPGALIRNRESRLRGVVTIVDDELSARWNNGLPGHLALLPLREQPGLGGIVHVDWEHGPDSCWARADTLELVDREGLYWVWPQSRGRAPIHRLAIGRGEPHWWDTSAELPAGYSWASRDDQAVRSALAGTPVAVS